ncbi:hypothetical protein [Streptomyces olivochromogenes]|uniref:hypothetical protein n=1 Tax=Streptomyces olivochromogenes TaxID=1963 RepID=UPI001F21995B|nr:hypothetical protein [Streptomyces olivochromogenes]
MNSLARWARAEWGLLHVTVREPLQKRHLRAIPMTVGAVCLTALLHFTQSRPWGYRFITDVGTVRAEDPLWSALLRTPLSLFVPALDLPVWGALAQILFVFGIAELCLGRRRTLAVAYVATLAGTLYARVGIALGPDAPLGLSASDARVVDTGPSAAVVGLAVYVGWRYGAYVTAGAVVAAMVVEVLLKENLAGKEHLAAIAGVTVLCVLPPALWQRRRQWSRRWSARRPPQGWRRRRWRRPRQWQWFRQVRRRCHRWPGNRAGSGSGRPPIQS